MKKKFLALVLTLAMVLSLVPVTALAVDESTQDTPDVITYQEGTPQKDYPEGLTTLNKKAEKIPGTDNQYKVTLTVGMSQKTETVVTSQEAATVLVIDISNSMGCTKKEHKHTDECYETEKIKCTPESKPDHWVRDKNFIGKEDLRHKDKRDNFQSECEYDYLYRGYYYDGETKLVCREEEHSYNDNCHTRLTDAKDAARAFVETYAGTQEGRGRDLSIVLFNYNPSVKLDWTDVSTANGKTQALKTIQDITLGKYKDGGTNLKGGLYTAGEKLRDTAVADLARDNKNVIVLTDGAPTQRTPLGGSAGSADLNEKTANEATNLKEQANIYTICFGAAGDYTYTSYWGNGPTVGDFLRDSIATDSNHAYNADNAGQLNNAFKEISENITSGLSAGTVHDALPDGVSSEAFDEGTTAKWDLSTFETRTYNEGDTTHYTYTKTYTVTIDPNSVNPKLFDENNYYPLNNLTTLKVNVKENGQDTKKTLNFPIPGAKVSYTVTFNSMGGSAVASQKVNRGETATTPTEPTQEGYKFQGWCTDEDTTEDYDFGTPVTQNITLYAKWEAKSYGVVYEYVSDTAGKDLPAEISVSSGNYEVSDSTTYYAGATVTRQTSPADGATYNVVKNGVTIGTWTLKWEGEATRAMTSSGVKFVGKWTYQAAPEPGKWTYTINQNFIDATGKKTTQSVEKDVLDTTTQTLKESIPDEMKKNQNVGDPAKNYVYVPAETTYKVGGQLKKETDKLANGAVIDLYYYLDVIGGKDEKGNLIDKGDEIPDCYQVTIIYKSSDENRGKISDANPKKEVLTITDKDGNRLSSGKVEITGASAEVTGSRCYFSNWTNDDNQQIAASATLGKQIIANAKGGATYTFTANFGRSSGGSNRPKPPVVEIPDDVPTGLNGKDHYAYVVGYPDGMVYPQKNITRAEVATIFFRLLEDETREANMTKSNGYNDMKDGAWYTCAVSTLSKMGIIKGYEDGSFKPDASISRAEFAAIAARFDPDGDKTPATFSDVSSHWAKDEISIAANHGWIKGYEDGSFKPDQKITRAETMTLVNRVLKRLPETKDDLHKDMKTWPDNQKESAWFYLAVQEATNSHYQKLKKDGIHETWESMRETRDWAALEK